MTIFWIITPKDAENGRQLVEAQHSWDRLLLYPDEESAAAWLQRAFHINNQSNWVIVPVEVKVKAV